MKNLNISCHAGSDPEEESESDGEYVDNGSQPDSGSSYSTEHTGEMSEVSNVSLSDSDVEEDNNGPAKKVKGTSSGNNGLQPQSMSSTDDSDDDEQIDWGALLSSLSSTDEEDVNMEDSMEGSDVDEDPEPLPPSPPPPPPMSYSQIQDNTFMVNVAPASGYWSGSEFRFEVNMSLDDNEPPTVKCLSKVFHPNIAETGGNVCMTMLRQPVNNPEAVCWKTYYKIQDVANGIESMFTIETFSEPLNPTAANLLENNREEFAQRVKDYK